MQREGRPQVDRFGGTEGNEILTCAIAAVLTVLLIAEGITIIRIGQLLTPHMLIGLILVPPVLAKLGSTGYRFARYYTRAPAYRGKGPPLLPLRLLAPVLVVTTIGVFATGVWLLLLGHRSNELILVHKVLFIVWGAVFGIHFLAYTPQVVRSLSAEWRSFPELPGSRLRGVLVMGSLATGVALALSLLDPVRDWAASGVG